MSAIPKPQCECWRDPHLEMVSESILKQVTTSRVSPVVDELLLSGICTTALPYCLGLAFSVMAVHAACRQANTTQLPEMSLMLRILDNSHQMARQRIIEAFTSSATPEGSC